MSVQNKVADMSKAINVFTKTLMWKLTEGHPVEQEEIDALNEMRVGAGMKPLNIAIPSSSQPAAEKKAPAYEPKQQYQTPRSQSEGKPPRSRKPPKTDENTPFNPEAIAINGREFEGQLLPDGPQWTNRFYIKSESSGRLYTIAQNKNRRYWGCDCPGWIGHRHCKHLTALGLPGDEKPFEAQIGASAGKTSSALIKFADENWSEAVHILAAELIHSDGELSKMMEPIENAYGQAHIDGPEAGASNDELNANQHEESGVPVTDGGIKSPERQNVNAIREAIETQAEMEVGKPIEVKQEQVDHAVEQSEAKLNGEAPATEVSAKPGTQIIINVGSKEAAKKVAYVKHCPGHKNSKGESAEWCIYSHETGKIISSEKSEGAAKKQLQNMHAHSGSEEGGAWSISGVTPNKETSEDVNKALKRMKAAQSADWCDNCINRLHPQILMSTAPGYEQTGTCARCGNENAFVRAVQVPIEKHSVDPIGGENQGGITSGQGGGMFGGTDLEGPQFHVGFTFRGTQREASFSSFKEASTFIKNASAKFGKTAGSFSMKCPRCGKEATKPNHEESYQCKGCGWNSHTGSNKQAKIAKQQKQVAPDPQFVEAMVAAVLRDTAARAMEKDIPLARLVSIIKTKIKRVVRGNTAIISVYIPEDDTEYIMKLPKEQAEKGNYKHNPYMDAATGLPKAGAADPAKRNLVLEILSHGPKTTGEIEKALGGGKYTNISWPILNELLKDGVLAHKQMRWSLKASVKTAEWKGWNENMPVQVVGDRDHEVFPNLAAAKAKYPTLDPEHNTNDFTWAMRGEIKGVPAIRFETWPANKMYSASVKKAYKVGKVAFSVQTRINKDAKNPLTPEVVANKLNEVFQDLKRKNPQGYMDSFEQQLPSFMMDIAQALHLQVDYTPEDDTYMFYDTLGAGTKGKKFEEFEQVQSSLKNATVRVTSTKSMPQKGTPEWHQLQIAVQTMKMPDPMANVMGGPDRTESERILAQYGLKWDEEAYMAGGSGVKKAGDGMAKTVEVDKEAGFNFFFPGQVVKEFYPEIQHEIVDYPNATNQPMSGAGNPEIVGDGGHELEGMLDEALDTNIVEMIQLPADVGEVEPLAMAAADYSSTSPASGMGIGRDGKPEVLEGAPLRKENDIRGAMFTDEFYGQYEGIPGAAMAVASKTAAEGDEVKQFSLFLKKVCGEIAATLVAAFKVTTRPLLDKVPGMGELQLDVIEQGSQTAMPLGQTTQGGRVRWLMDKLNDGDIKNAINEAWAQAAVWNDNSDGGFVYEVFVRPETIDTDSLVMKYKFVCGTRE
jgi:hypothetical protein